MSAYDLVDAVKKAKGIPSDNALAIELGLTRGSVSSWKRGDSKPDGENVLKLCLIGGIEPKKALELMQGGFAYVSLMIMTGLAALPFTHAVLWLKDCILC